MKSLSDRIKKRIKMTVDNFSSDCQISYNLAFLRMADDLSSRIGLKKISKYFHKKKENWISSYLENLLAEIILKYKDDNYTGEFSMEQPIWICWWTGEETAPELVKKCIQSIRKNAGNHPVNFIDKNTYLQYIDIPNYILDKAEKGYMGLAHLSDYIRVSLIEKYGGLWLDTTIFCSGVIPDSYFDIPFFTCKSDVIDCGYLSKMRWTTFVLAGWKKNIFYRFIKESFEKYWSDENVAIDYLFFDHLIDIAYRNISSIKEQVDNVPLNNPHRDDLQAAMNNALPAEEFEKTIQKDTVLYKLSWRETYSLKTFDGKSSIYDYYLKM